MTDLTMEQLEEWSDRIDAHYRDNPDRNDLSTVIPTHEFSRLIAMAKRTASAECERDAYLAIADTKVAELAEVERERDALRKVIVATENDGYLPWDRDERGYYDECIFCRTKAPVHTPDCIWRAALAHPTSGAGGAE